MNSEQNFQSVQANRVAVVSDVLDEGVSSGEAQAVWTEAMVKWQEGEVSFLAAFEYVLHRRGLMPERI